MCVRMYECIKCVYICVDVEVHESVSVYVRVFE